MADVKEKVIMLVDDSSVNNLLMQSILEEAGYSTISYSSSADAMIQLKKQRPSLIILDIMMPGSDGFDVLESIKNDREMYLTPVIMLTARNNQRDRQKAIAMGAIDYITKPIDIEDVLLRVHTAMEVEQA